MDIDLDHLLSLPKTGGAIDSAFTLMTRDEIGKKKTDIHTTPIIMTEKTPAGTRELNEVTAFLGISGLQVTDILAFNGEAVHKLLTTPKDTGKGINEKLFLVENTYGNVSDLLEKQVAFISLFHHLFFLAKLAKTPGYPMFTDSFSDKFMAIQKSLNEIKEVKMEPSDKSTVAGAANISTEAGFDDISIKEGSQGPPVTSTIFNTSFKDITKFWDELNSKLLLTDMIAVFKKTPEEIYNWFSSDSAVAPAAVAAAAAAPSAATGSTNSSSQTSVVEGANLKKEVTDFIDTMYNKSGHEEAPPETPPPPPPEDTNQAPSAAEAAEVDVLGPPPTAEEAEQNKKRMATEKGLATKAAKKAVKAAENTAAAQTQESRAAKLAAKEKIEQTIAELKPGAAAEAAAHKAVNNSDSQDDEDVGNSTTGIPETENPK